MEGGKEGRNEGVSRQAEHNTIKHSKAKQSKAKQSKAKQSNAKVPQFGLTKRKDSFILLLKSLSTCMCMCVCVCNNSKHARIRSDLHRIMG